MRRARDLVQRVPGAEEGTPANRSQRLSRPDDRSGRESQGKL
jgi:hypothetical protein